MINTELSVWPSFTDEEAQAVSRVLLSNRVNYWTGSECRDFEREFAQMCGTSQAVALTNGTAALELAFKALHLGPGDEVVVTPRTFMASASSIVAVGALPVFADVDLDSQNISAESVARVLTPRTKAVLCVHLAGWPCEMNALSELANERGLHLVEDCAQAHGATYHGTVVGNLSAIAAWSFCQDKIITTGGEGGMVTTNDEALWRSVWSYKDHGKSYDAVYHRDHPPGFRWLHESFGTNLRMLELQAVIGRIQLRKLPAWHERRKSNAGTILAACSTCPALRVPVVPAHIEHAWYRAYAFVRPEALRADWNRDRVMNEIVARGVPCYAGSCSEVYLERAFDGTPFRPQQRLANARALGDTSLMFLVHPTLTEAEIAKTAAVICNVMSQATR